MVSSFVRLVAVVCSLIIVISFGYFVANQAQGGTSDATQEIQGVEHPVLAPPKPVHQPRRFIDAAAHDLTTPFNGIVSSTAGEWPRHIVPDLLGLILYSVGLGFLARYASGRA
jgi:hypothetical protein